MTFETRMSNDPDYAKSPSSLDVFGHNASAELLAACIEHKRRTSRYFSVAAWSRKLGLPTSGIIVNLIKGRRLLSEELATRVAVDLGFTEKERDYFLALVAYERALHAESLTAPMLKKRLESYRFENRAGSREDRFEEVSDLKRGLVAISTELRGEAHAQEDLCRRSTVPLEPGEADRILQELIQKGLVERAADGSCRLVGTIESPHETPSAATKRWHRESLEHAIATLATHDVSERHFLNYMMCMSSDRLPEAKRALDRFMYEFSVEFEAKPGQGDRVFQLNLNLVPLAESGESKGALS